MSSIQPCQKIGKKKFLLKFRIAGTLKVFIFQNRDDSSGGAKGGVRYLFFALLFPSINLLQNPERLITRLKIFCDK